MKVHHEPQDKPWTTGWFWIISMQLDFRAKTAVSIVKKQTRGCAQCFIFFIWLCVFLMLLGEVSVSCAEFLCVVWEEELCLTCTPQCRSQKWANWYFRLCKREKCKKSCRGQRESCGCAQSPTPILPGRVSDMSSNSAICVWNASKKIVLENPPVPVSW